MKKNMKHYSGKALTKTSVIFSLSALLCIPACGYAENAEAKEMAVQVVQQSRTVKGTITDETGEPMIGVTVRVKGSRAAAVTDLDGKFSLSANQGDFIEVSYVGYETTTVKVTSNTLNLQLKPVASDLDEVVVIGFGTVKKRDLTGSVASIKADAIVQTPTSDVATALQGRISGLDINGDDMRIRGNRSINGSNDPLVIIDGVQGGSMSDLNPNDIESIDVLKDASSTAIYGSQGANGVIIITTKKAEAGKMQVSYDGYVTAAFRPDRAEYRSPENYYETLKLAAQNAGLWNSTNDDASLFSDLESYAAFRAGVWTDYEKLLQKDVTWSNKHTVTLSGGTEKTQARFSLGYANDGNKWKRSSGTDKYTLRANIDHKLYSWINAGVNFQLTHSRNASSPYEKATTTSLELGSPYGVYDAETDTYNIGNTLVERPLASDGYVNPLIDGAGDDLYKNESYFTNIVANAYVDIHPIEGLTFRSQLNTHITNSSEGTYTDGKSAANLDKTGQKSTAEMTKASGTYIEWNNILTYNFTKLPNDHHLGVTLLTTWNKTIKDEMSATSKGQTIPGNLWWNLGSNDGEDGSSIHSSLYTQAQNFSYAGRISYDWKSRYLVTASLRRDGSSKLADGNKWDWFPSAALAWRISDEAFMKKTKSWLDDLKIRATYGVTGNAGIGVYGTQSGVTFANWSFGFQDISANRYILGVADQNGSGYYVIANKDTKWEKSTTFDLGFDAVLLNNRLSVTFDWYNTKTTDLILLRSLPTSAGMDGKYATYTNIGSTKNTGFEFTVNSRNIVTKDFSWSSTLTFSANREKITDLVDGTDIMIGTAKETQTLMIGHPIKSYNTFKYLGIWTTAEADEAAKYFKDAEKTNPFKPGDIKVADLNGDYVIDQNDDIGYVGSTSPDWFAGFNNDLRYKNWDLNIYLYARWGQWAESKVANYDPSTGGMTTNFDYWAAGTNEGGSLPALYKGRNLYDYVGYQALAYCDNSFIKLKRITLGYTLPKSALKAMRISNLRIYATINDPLYFVKNEWQKNYDPEGNQRSVTIGLNVNF